MKRYTVHFQDAGVTVPVEEGTTLLQAQIQAGLRPDAPCGGKGTCGKCVLRLDGAEVLACQTPVDRDMNLSASQGGPARILTGAQTVSFQPDATADYCLAFDLGTTTLVGYLLDGKTGALLARQGAMNPQTQFGADVITRIQWALEGQGPLLRDCVRQALSDMTWALARQAGITPAQITAAALVGNTAMHHLLLGIDPRPLITPPYMPEVRQAMEVEGLLPAACRVRLLPNIAGFVGGDTVGCLVSTRFDRLEELTLLIDIGTNGEMVLGNRHRRIACSTAAGPAFEGAKISCGMRGAEGAVDQVFLEQGEIRFHVIGGGDPKGICGSGLLDLIAVLLERGLVDESGHLENGTYSLAPGVRVTQKDVREVQLAKAAIRAGIQLLSVQLGVEVEQIQTVCLAGAFGNYMNPASACRIGMIPPALEGRVRPIGNAAGEGARLCSLSRWEYDYSKRLAEGTEFLELAGLPEFQDCFVDALEFSEDGYDL